MHKDWMSNDREMPTIPVDFAPACSKICLCRCRIADSFNSIQNDGFAYTKSSIDSIWINDSSLTDLSHKWKHRPILWKININVYKMPDTGQNLMAIEYRIGFNEIESGVRHEAGCSTIATSPASCQSQRRPIDSRTNVCVEFWPCMCVHIYTISARRFCACVRVLCALVCERVSASVRANIILLDCCRCLTSEYYSIQTACVGWLGFSHIPHIYTLYWNWNSDDKVKSKSTLSAG